ncbi:MAG: hypothetical protein U0P45_08470 [Acidimicrobiales bacterium]
MRLLLAVTLALGGSGALSSVVAAGAVGAAPTIPGLQVAPNQRVDGSLQPVITLTGPHALEVRCRDDVLLLEGVDSTIACSRISSLRIIGSSATDGVDVDLVTGAPATYAPYVGVQLGDGNDVAKVLHRGTLQVQGGPGSDRLTDAAATGAVGSISTDQLFGDDGDDILTNLGYVQGTPPTITAANAWDHAATMIGGPGADTIRGATNRPDAADIDLTDTVSLGTGPALVWLSTTQQTDLVTVHANGSYGPKVSVTRAGKTWSTSLPTLTYALTINTLGGPDQVTVDGKSIRAPILVDPGSGTDAMTIRPWPGYRWDKAAGVVTQPGAQPISYVAKRLEAVSIRSL